MTKQYGFYFDADRCIQCRTCELACKSAHNTEPGIKWRRVTEIWGGSYPDITRTFFSLACMHCKEPACVAVCPTGAISKRDDGIVVVDPNMCNGCRDCFPACPYKVPQFAEDGTMQKCDYCTGLGREPACVEHCPTEALRYGTMEELSKLAAEKGAQKLTGHTKPSLYISHKKENSKLLEVGIL